MKRSAERILTTHIGSLGTNEYYASSEEFLSAIAEAMRAEYLAIVDAGAALASDQLWRA